MPFIAKDPDKAKYLIRSLKHDGTRMKELTDTKAQALKYVEKCELEGRADIKTWLRVDLTKKKTGTSKRKARKA